MSDGLVINQRQGLGNDGTQVGVQNNNQNIDNSYNEQNNTTVNVDNHPTVYVGASLEEITRIVTNLFLDNFPRMQQVAKETAIASAKQLWDETVPKLLSANVINYGSFMDVDVQYVICEAQKSYARFSTNDLLEKLSTLIAERVKYNNDDMCLKVAIDQAVSVVGRISPSQLDYLSLIFLTTKVKFNNIDSLEKLKSHFEYLDNTFSKSRFSNWQYLNMLGCLQLDLPDVCKIAENNYGFSKADIENVCPKNIKNLSGDYSTSPVGTIIAIIHAQQKTDFHFNPKIWIHD